MKMLSSVPALSVLLTVIMVLPGVLGACTDGSRSSRSIYYIATNGSDTTGDGSSGTPWASDQQHYNVTPA